MIVIFCINNTSFYSIMKITIIIDIILNKLIVLSIYPMICTIKRDDELYSKRKLVEYLFMDIGILIGGFLIGRLVLGYIVDYNICLLISVVFSFISFFVLLTIKKKHALDEEKIDKDVDIIKYVKSRRLLQIYILYCIFGKIAMNIGLGLKMLMLTNMFKFSPSIATSFLLIIGLLADLIGIIALKYFTPKDDYLTVFIKFGIRMIGYVIACITNNLIICLLAITWSILISTAYENIVDGRYINSIPKEYQLPFNNLIHIASVIVAAIGLFFAGIM